VVATNLHADILSDLAAALAGSLGIAPTGNIDPERRYPSMFEPIHGSAFDIMGQGLANPVGTFWSCVMLLEHLGEPRRGSAADGGHRSRHRQPGAAHARPGRRATTAQVTQAVCQRVRCGTDPLNTTTKETTMKKPCCTWALALLAPLALAQPCPDKNVMYWQAFPPGGESDLSARHQQVVLKKKCRPSTPSSSTRPAPAARCCGAPDEPAARRRLNIVGINLPHMVLQPMEGKVQYKTEDITPVFWFHYTPDAWWCPSQPHQELCRLHQGGQGQAGQAQPGRLGPELGQPRGARALNAVFGVKTTYVPFKGTGDMAMAVLGAQSTAP
jgi:hypothetical protein